MGRWALDYPYPTENQMPCCPICGDECETIYENRNRNIIGCDNCINARDAWFWQEEIENDNYFSREEI